MSEVYVFTFKEGLLSAIAHDLKIRVTAHEVAIDDERAVTATFDASSLRVVCARKDGHDSPRALSDSDKKSIERTIVDEILEAKRFPQIRFASTSVEREGEGYRVRGDLTLRGVTRAIGFTTRVENGAKVAEVTLHQPDFGIKPYRAMLGTLKLQPDVRVRVEVP